VIGLSSLLLAGRMPQTKKLLEPSTENQLLWNYAWFDMPTTLVNHTQNLASLDVIFGARETD